MSQGRDPASNRCTDDPLAELEDPHQGIPRTRFPLPFTAKGCRPMQDPEVHSPAIVMESMSQEPVRVLPG